MNVVNVNLRSSSNDIDRYKVKDLFEIEKELVDEVWFQ